MAQTTAANIPWSLEVVRGKDAGRRFALALGPVVLGNAPGSNAAINLSDQEGTSPKRMAARQAQVECSNGAVTIRDLDSPGGTFVNRQRVLPNQARPLHEGDVIQLGGVQLKLVPASQPQPKSTPPPAPAQPQKATATPAPAASASKSAPVSFALKAGPTCRSWDDFLVISAQRWSDLRDELTSGRLAAYLASIGRADLAPNAKAPGTPDERLDDWLGRLPTTRSSGPELDVHPASLTINAASAGGSTERALRITNTGHRLLRTSARIEPAQTPWLKIGRAFAAGPFTTVEGTDLPIEVAIPIVVTAPMSADVVLESNGGTKRVTVRLEPTAKHESIPSGVAAAPIRAEWNIRERIARLSPTARIAWCAGLAFGVRVLVGLVGMVFSAPGRPQPDLFAPAVAFGLAGGVIAAWLGSRRGEIRDVPSCGFAGMVAGVLLAALVVAIFRAGEAPLDSFASSIWIAAPLWAAVGAGLAGLSVVLVPFKAPTKEPPP